MGFADWDDSYSVGVKKIDEQHRHLFRLINDLNRMSLGLESSKTLRDIMEEILEYTTYHFRTEEEIMKSVKFPGLEDHIKEHREMRERMTGHYYKCIDREFKCLNEVLEELIDWLHTHMARSDTLYVPYLNKEKPDS